MTGGSRRTTIGLALEGEQRGGVRRHGHGASAPGGDIGQVGALRRIARRSGKDNRVGLCRDGQGDGGGRQILVDDRHLANARSEEHTSELQSLMRNSYAVFCLKKKIKNIKHVYY